MLCDVYPSVMDQQKEIKVETWSYALVVDWIFKCGHSKMEADECNFAGAEFKRTKLRSPTYVTREKSVVSPANLVIFC